MSSEVVFIRRKDGRYGVPAEVSSMSRKAVGSYIRNGVVGIPMKISGDSDDIKWNRKVLGDLLNVSPTDVGFAKKVTEFFQDISVQVVSNIDDNENPIEGTKFEIGLDSEGYPLDLLGYVQYQHCINHPEVTMDKDKCINEKHLLYYIDRPAERQKLAADKLKDREDAIIKFAEIKLSKPELIDWIIAYNKQEPEGLTSDQKLIAVNTIIDKDPTLFIKLIDDPKLEVKTMIENLIEKERIQVVDTEYFFGDVKLGNGIDQAVRFIQNPKNTAIYNSIRAEYKNRFIK